MRKEFLVRQNEISFNEGKGVGEQFMLKVLERRKARLVCVHCKNAKEKKKKQMMTMMLTCSFFPH